MSRKLLVFPILAASVFLFASSGFSQDKSVVVKGIVESIAADGASMVVDGKTIITDKAFLDEAYLEAGDKVAVTAENTDKGLKAISFEYIFDEEAWPISQDEGFQDMPDDSDESDLGAE
ncbi:MAG: hypothetical protein PHU64_06170 [Candidatus Omnitrophica bacterium]|nr:hypothetical protein [Candidatus Omnitrophota bacterium]MDD5429508.1 hypothetical protein [Candidatus Omnitrophota bacterium]